MGVEQFFSSIEENPITNLKTPFTKILRHKIDTNYFCVDFNSIIYKTSFIIVSDLNYILYQIITDRTTNNKKFTELVNLYEFNSDTHNFSIGSFNSTFTEEKISKLVLEKTREYVINMISNYIVPEKLEYLYIALDGVPSKSKILMQKKRRYMGFLIAEIKNRIFEKYKDELSKEKHRYLFELNKISWNRNLITPGTVFMDDLDSMLNSKELVNDIKKICPNLKEYILSGVYEPGEGEKKIVDYLTLLGSKKSNYLIYSPDSDVTLLALLLNTKSVYGHLDNLKVLRQNQQRNDYDVIDIDLLANNIFGYVSKTIISSPKFVLDKDRIIDDIVLLLTIFGNDFVPKIESYTVRQDFNRIIDRYIETLKVNKNYIISYNHTLKKKVINQDVFIDLIRVLQMDEGGNLQKIYMASEYQNYNALKKLLNANQDNFTEVINDFLLKLREFNNDIRNLRDNNNIKYVIDKWTKPTAKDFINKLKRLARIYNKPTNFGDRINDDDFINSYAEYYFRENKLPYVAISFKKYSKSLDSDHHRNNLEKSLDYLDPNLKITKYDEEMYKFDNMLDEYSKKLNSYSLNLGYVKIDTKTFTWKTEKIVKGVKRYYAEFFGITGDISLNNKEMTKVIESYITGLMWVFEYYFNNFDIGYNRQHAYTWFYEYTHAPLLSQIYQFLYSKKNVKNYLLNICDDVLKETARMDEYFNPLEHLMYVSPAKSPAMINIFPQEYHEFINKSGYYPDITKIVDSIWKNETNTDIDCRGAIFITKCELETVTPYDFKTDKKNFLDPLRKIKLDKDTMKRTSNFSMKKSNVSVHKL